MAKNDLRKTQVRKAFQLRHSVLVRAEELLAQIESEHQRGTDWVPLDEEPCAAVRTLEKLDMIQVIKFNDGEHYGQIKGANL